MSTIYTDRMEISYDLLLARVSYICYLWPDASSVLYVFRLIMDKNSGRIFCVISILLTPTTSRQLVCSERFSGMYLNKHTTKYIWLFSNKYHMGFLDSQIYFSCKEANQVVVETLRNYELKRTVNRRCIYFQKIDVEMLMKRWLWMELAIYIYMKDNSKSLMLISNVPQPTLHRWL